MLGVTGWQFRGRGVLYSHAVTARRERIMKAAAGGRFWYLMIAGARPEAAAHFAAVLKPVLDDVRPRARALARAR